MPPEVLAAESTAVKTFPLNGGGTAHFFFGSNDRAVGEVEKAGRTAAVVSRVAGKVDLVQAAQSLRRKR